MDRHGGSPSARRSRITEYIDADLHEPDTIIAGAAKTLDLTRPVAVMLLGIVHFILDDDEAQAIVRRLVDAVPPGSYLVINHATTEVTPEATSATFRYIPALGGRPPPS